MLGLGCGWCYDKSNPTKGQCLSGSFNMTSSFCPNEWAYDECPDIDECQLGLHNCHVDGICLNIEGSFECQCKKGFVGDGHISCDRTCYEDCINGKVCTYF